MADGNQAPANSWKFSWYPEQTFHPVFLGAPQMVPQNEAEARQWAQDIGNLLTTPQAELGGRTPLDGPPRKVDKNGNPNAVDEHAHLTVRK
jgi:hypothetical protein